MCSRLFASALQKKVAFMAAVFRLDLSREKTGLENPQIFQTCKEKIIFPLNMVRAKRRPFQIVRLLLCADICRHGIHGIVVQGILLYRARLPAGEDLRIRESIVQRPQPL